MNLPLGAPDPCGLCPRGSRRSGDSPIPLWGRQEQRFHLVRPISPPAGPRQDGSGMSLLLPPRRRPSYLSDLLPRSQRRAPHTCLPFPRTPASAQFQTMGSASSTWQAFLGTQPCGGPHARHEGTAGSHSSPTPGPREQPVHGDTGADQRACGESRAATRTGHHEVPREAPDSGDGGWPRHSDAGLRPERTGRGPPPQPRWGWAHASLLPHPSPASVTL